MNTINLVFIQFYNMQSLYECLEEKKTPQFRKCRMTFAMEVHAAAVVSRLVLLGLSLKEHPSKDRHPSKGKEALSNTQELQQVSKGINT